LGGLGISDLKSLCISLRARWPWLKKVEHNKPWAALPLQVSREVDSFVSMAVVSEIGDGTNTLFWRDRWVAGKSIQDMAPRLLSYVSKHRINKRTVSEALEK
jgi:hypothetical protein